MTLIQSLNLAEIDEGRFKRRFVGCIVLTHDNKVLLQQRGEDWHTFPGYISTFGGRIEPCEAPVRALIRELKEELGAEVHESDIVSLGAYTEAVTKHSELVYGYFWHDKHATITGCYEGEPRYFDSCHSVFTYSKSMMDDVSWLLQECQRRRLLK